MPSESTEMSIGPPRAVDRLPIEIYRLILSEMTIKDLEPLLLTSKALKIEAERLIFADVLINHGPSSHGGSYLAHIATRPHIPPLIAGLHVYGIEGSNFLELNQILIAAINLKNLDLHYMFETSLGALTAGVTFKLRHLGSSLLLHPACISFLRSQTEITDLNISNRNPQPGPEIFSPGLIIHLPRLKTLITTLDDDDRLKAVLLANRSITHCQFGHYSGGLLPSTTIKSLCINSGFGSPHLGGGFPNLEFLQLMVDPEVSSGLIVNLPLPLSVLISPITRQSTTLVEIIKNHPQLKKVKLYLRQRSESVVSLGAAIFNATRTANGGGHRLQLLHIAHGLAGDRQGWKLTRGFENDESLVVRADTWEGEEWRTWGG